MVKSSGLGHLLAGSLWACGSCILRPQCPCLHNGMALCELPGTHLWQHGASEHYVVATSASGSCPDCCLLPGEP